MPQADRIDEVALDERFAKAHKFEPGDRFSAVIGERKLDLRVTAVVLSPEFVYAIAPGDMVPDDRRYAVFYMGETAMAGLFDMKDAFNDVSLRLMRGASESEVKAKLDSLLAQYGGRGSFGRDEQLSHAFLDNELTQLNAMARVIPPIFLFVSAFLVNMILTRLISLEREQIGLLKACGYTSLAIAWHYSKLVIAICLVGLLLGGVAGSWFGNGMTRLYAQFFSFPILIFRSSPDLYGIAALVTVAFAMAGAARAVWGAVAMPPAVAMRPPAPERFRSVFGGAGPLRLFSQLTRMALRHLLHRPVRSALSTLGVSFAVALLIIALFSKDSIEFMIETVFFRAEPADARLSFARDLAPGTISDVERLPGVIAAETFRVAPVILRNGHRSKRIAITGRHEQGRLSRVLDLEGESVAMPANGILLTDRLANHLGTGPGRTVEVEMIENGHRVERVPVAGIVESYVGLAAHMDIAALDRLSGTGPRISGAWVDVDPLRLSALNRQLKSTTLLGERWEGTRGAVAGLGAMLPGFLYATVKETPALGTIALQTLSRDKFRETIEQNIDISMSIYIVVAVIVAFGVVYNSARIQLSERARELASLRVLGFTRAEVARVLMGELGAIVIAAQPLGWLIGYLFALSLVKGLASDLFTFPLVIYPPTFAYSSLIVVAAAAFSALIVRRRIHHLDLIRVLKTRE
jgi:putative ABC transport system permease protein